MNELKSGICHPAFLKICHEYGLLYYLLPRNVRLYMPDMAFDELDRYFDRKIVQDIKSYICRMETSEVDAARIMSLSPQHRISMKESEWLMFFAAEKSGLPVYVFNRPHIVYAQQNNYEFITLFDVVRHLCSENIIDAEVALSHMKTLAEQSVLMLGFEMCYSEVFKKITDKLQNEGYVGLDGVKDDFYGGVISYENTASEVVSENVSGYVVKQQLR